MRRDITLDGDDAPLESFDFSSFFDVTNMSIVISDARLPDMPIIYVNRAFELTTGYARSFAVGRNCRFLQGEDTDPAAVRHMRDAISRGSPITEVVLNYRPDGTSFLNEVVLTPIHNKSGTLVFYVGVQNVVNEKLREKMGETKNLNLVRSLQRHISSHLDVVMDISSLEGSKDRERTTQDFLRRVMTLDVLYRDLGSHLADDDVVDLGAYVSHIASVCSAELARFGVRVNISTNSISAPIDYAVRMGLLLQEMLENALKHAFTGRDTGFVEVTLRIENDDMMLSVSDDGIGLKPEDSPWPEKGQFGAAVMRHLLKLTHSHVDFDSSEHGTVIEVVSSLSKNGLSADND